MPTDIAIFDELTEAHQLLVLLRDKRGIKEHKVYEPALTKVIELIDELQISLAGEMTK